MTNTTPTPTAKHRVVADLDPAAQSALAELQAIVGDLTGDRTIAAAVRYAVLTAARTMRSSRAV